MWTNWCYKVLLANLIRNPLEFLPSLFLILLLLLLHVVRGLLLGFYGIPTESGRPQQSNQLTNSSSIVVGIPSLLDSFNRLAIVTKVQTRILPLFCLCFSQRPPHPRQRIYVHMQQWKRWRTGQGKARVRNDLWHCHYIHSLTPGMCRVTHILVPTTTSTVCPDIMY